MTGTERRRESHKDLDPKLVSAFADTFISRHDVYPFQLPDGTYVFAKRQLTDTVVEGHIKGFITLGAYAHDAHGWCKWLCFDADDGKWFAKLGEISRDLAGKDVPSYLELSRRGGHLWIFTPTIPGFQMRRFGQQLMADYKLPKAIPEVPGVELYPKQDVPPLVGSCVRLPFGIHQRTGKRYHFVAPDGTPLAPTIREQLAVFANPSRVSQKVIDVYLAHAPEAVEARPTPAFQLKVELGGKLSERIKHRISVFDFVSQYVQLDSRGRGKCPFHEDEHPTFSVDKRGNYWQCFAGCEGNTIIDFWRQWRRRHSKSDEWKDTLKDLAAMLGL